MHSFLLKNTAFIRCGSVVELEKFRTMSSKDGLHGRKDEEDKDFDNILDSPACRRLFTWGRSKDAIFNSDEGSQKQKEEERLRWNFDFETETPLPGRYQWYKDDKSNGHKNGSGSKSTDASGDVVEHRRTRTKASSTPYTRKSRSLETEKDNPSSSGSRDTPSLSEPRRSERRSQTQLKKTHCRFKWE